MWLTVNLRNAFQLKIHSRYQEGKLFLKWSLLWGWRIYFCERYDPHPQIFRACDLRQSLVLIAFSTTDRRTDVRVRFNLHAILSSFFYIHVVPTTYVPCIIFCTIRTSINRYWTYNEWQEQRLSHISSNSFSSAVLLSTTTQSPSNWNVNSNLFARDKNNVSGIFNLKNFFFLLLHLLLLM